MQAIRPFCTVCSRRSAAAAAAAAATNEAATQFADDQMNVVNHGIKTGRVGQQTLTRPTLEMRKPSSLLNV